MKKIVLHISIIVMFLFNACEKIIDLDVEESEKKICVNSIFHCDSTITASVYKSVSILEPDTFFNIDNAVLRLYDDNDSSGFIFQESGEYISQFTSVQYGKEYNIDVDVSGLQSVHSSCFIPEPIQIIKVDTSLRVISNSYDDLFFSEYYEFEIKMDFQDPPNEENYYALVVRAPQIDWEKTMFNDFHEPDSIIYTYRNANIDSDDHLVLDSEGWEINNIKIFNDKLIDGKEYTLVFSVDLEEDEEIKKYPIQLELRSIPKDLYLYYLSYSLQMITGDSPFSEPVQVYSNISEGYGIFAGYSSDIVYIER